MGVELRLSQPYRIQPAPCPVGRPRSRLNFCIAHRTRYSSMHSVVIQVRDSHPPLTTRRRHVPSLMYCGCNRVTASDVVDTASLHWQPAAIPENSAPR